MTRQEEWNCPRCGLIGDDGKTTKGVCRTCTTVDAAEDLLRELKQAASFVAGVRDGLGSTHPDFPRVAKLFERFTASIAKAEGS